MLKRYRIAILIFAVVLLFATHRYAWWLGENAWYPANEIRVSHAGVLIDAKVYKSRIGKAIIWESKKERFAFTIVSTGYGNPQLFSGVAFNDYGFFALPVGSIGVPVTADYPKTEFDPKLSWTPEHRLTFRDFLRHEIVIDPPY